MSSPAHEHAEDLRGEGLEQGGQSRDGRGHLEEDKGQDGGIGWIVFHRVFAKVNEDLVESVDRLEQLNVRRAHVMRHLAVARQDAGEHDDGKGEVRESRIIRCCVFPCTQSGRGQVLVEEDGDALLRSAEGEHVSANLHRSRAQKRC